MSVFANIATRPGLLKICLAIAKAATVGKTAKGLKAKLAPIPAATNPPAAPPLPDSLRVKESIDL